MFTRRNARRLSAMAALVAMALASGAPAASIIQISDLRSAPGLGALGGAIDYTAAPALTIGRSFDLALQHHEQPNALATFQRQPLVCQKPTDHDGLATVAMMSIAGIDRQRSPMRAASGGGMFKFTITAQHAASMSSMNHLASAAFDRPIAGKQRGEGALGVSGTVTATVVPLPPAAAMGLVGLLGAAIFSKRINKSIRQ
jgi:hypothetical protein